jgi:hypothetical protein
MNSILADLITALAGGVFLGGVIWLASARLSDEPVPTTAVVVSGAAATTVIVAGAIAAGLRAANRRKGR